jgi:hypothetical protein
VTTVRRGAAPDFGYNTLGAALRAALISAGSDRGCADGFGKFAFAVGAVAEAAHHLAQYVVARETPVAQMVGGASELQRIGRLRLHQGFDRIDDLDHAAILAQQVVAAAQQAAAPAGALASIRSMGSARQRLAAEKGQRQCVHRRRVFQRRGMPDAGNHAQHRTGNAGL